MEKLLRLFSLLFFLCVANCFAQQQQPSRGYEFMSWFPRVKQKMLRAYNNNELFGMNLRAMERIIEERKQAGALNPRDFLEINGKYEEFKVEEAAARMYNKVSHSNAEMIVKNAIVRQLMDAEDAAYIYLESKGRRGPVSKHSFHEGGF